MLMSDDMLPQGLQLTKTAWSQRLETAEKSARLRREVPFVANTQFLSFKFQKPQGSIGTSMWISKSLSGEEQVAVRGQGGPEDGERE